MKEAEYFRFLLSQKPMDYPEIRKLLTELINQVNYIGRNINQIVYNNNSGLYYERDKVQLVAYMRKLNDMVNEAVKKIGNQ
ncbi:MAG: plasmid mobilization relaxosome protein MobC [Lachnospiraceae bacterium]|nr:plasmid mobilization relaxosome protein MobC [Lachnospiraceae bacterium]